MFYLVQLKLLKFVSAYDRKLEFIFKDKNIKKFRARFRIFNVLFPLVSRETNNQIMGTIEQICKIYKIELKENPMVF